MSLIEKYCSITALVLGFILATSAQLEADIVVNSGSFDFEMPNANGSGSFDVVTSQFSLTSADIPDVSFSANFFVIDAGIQVLVNGTPLFSTGNDVSQFGPRVFDTGLGVMSGEDGNIEDPFGEIGPAGAPLPRLTVQSDSTGTSFSGVATTTPGIGPVVSFTPNPSINGINNGSDFSNISNFSSLLVDGPNTIEIVNLNSYQGASLAGDFTVTLAETTSVPEPTSLLGLLTLIGTMSMRRRRA